MTVIEAMTNIRKEQEEVADTTDGNTWKSAPIPPCLECWTCLGSKMHVQGGCGPSLLVL